MTPTKRKSESKARTLAPKARVSEPRRPACALPMGDLEIEFEFEIPYVEGEA